MARSEPPLIVGAGPTGLAAALFLSHRGVACRVVEERSSPVETSRALGVNPRTMAILKGTGVDQAIAAEGLPMRFLNAHQNGRRLARLEIPTRAVGSEWPMIILPQARTEALLAEALAARGIKVERGRPLSGLEQDADGVTAAVAKETVRAPVVLGADGAHSPVRHALGVGFPGTAFPETWQLVDVELEGPDIIEAWADFRPAGPFVALPFNAHLWRLIGFGPPLLENLPKGWKAGKVAWASEFHVSHRVAEQFNVGRVCLAGDAAHIHSPIGARGMNLGIEDAFVWAACAEAFLKGDASKLAAYGESRRHFDTGVVQRVERLTNGVRARGRLAELLRPLILPAVAALPPLRNAILRQGIGLDHPLVIP
jgi:2-polyprenyl-6-methoxyphenol hydroxylase-like FAD-dependent oxidoreductase